MRSTFTPGAERALAAAAGWISSDESDELDLPEILLGLLAEPECRAALMLARHQVDIASVRRQFPSLREVILGAEPLRTESQRFSRCLQTVEQLLGDYPRPLELATEHLLLGLLLSESSVARWLAEQGLTAADLEAEVHRLAGFEPGPLPLEPLDIDFDEPRRPAPLVINHHRADHIEPLVCEELSAIRIIDAAANRAGEGLRVIEDYLRFHLDDRHLTRLAKSIRHDLTAALSAFSSDVRHAARETRADVGTSVTLPSETERSDLAAVLVASFKRVEQSLRSLEEYSKTVAPETAAALEQLRYRVYTLERITDITQASLERLADAQLYVLIDAGRSESQLRQFARTLAVAGAGIIQLREKHLPDRELLARARIVREATVDTATLFIMNDRPDLALLSGADGVHVGQEEISVKDARRILGTRALVGVSTHSLSQAHAAVLDGADYIGVGPTFPSGTKQFREFTGVELLRDVAAEIRLPAFAIGGITAKNLPDVLAAGFTRVAVSGSITAAEDPAAAARELASQLRR
jgi:thiamine-phosphate pyrophosphorylase